MNDGKLFIISLISVLQFITLSIKCETLSFLLFIDDSMEQFFVNDQLYTKSSNCNITSGYHLCTANGNEGDIIRLIIHNGSGPVGIRGNVTINDNLYQVNPDCDDCNIFWYVDSPYIWGNFQYFYSFVQDNISIYSFEGENETNYNFYFSYPYNFNIDYNYHLQHNGYDTSLDSIGSAQSYSILFSLLPSNGVLSINDQSVEIDHEYVVSSITSMVYKSSVSGIVDKVEFRKKSSVEDANTNKYYIVYIVGEDGYDCNYNTSASRYVPQCKDTCRSGYFHLIDDTSKCVSEETKPDGYYLDSTTSIFEKCYSRCKTCSAINTPTAHGCISCNTPYHLIEDQPSNCVSPEEIVEDIYFLEGDTYRIRCNTILDENGLRHCDPCDDPSNLYFDQSIKTCVSVCPSNSFTYQQYCLIHCPVGTTEVGTACLDIFTLTEEDEVTSVFPLEDIVVNIEENIVEMSRTCTNIKGDGYYVQIISSKDSNEEREGVSTINLGECETVLREENNIGEEEELIILKFDIEDKTSITNKVEYKVYDSEGNELDLSVCKGVPVEINYVLSNVSGINFEFAKELSSLGVDMYNPKDDFYNDNCFPYSGESGDVVLSDRREKIFKNVSFCEEGCFFGGVNYTTNKVLCNCTGLDSDESEQFDELNEGFLSGLLKATNLKVLKCYTILNKVEVYKNNYGFYISLIVFFLQLILTTHFIGIGYQSLVVALNKYPKPPSVSVSAIQCDSTNDTFEYKVVKEPVSENEDNKGDYEDMMNLPYKEASSVDDRNCLSIIYKVFLSKIDLITIFFFRGEFELFSISLSLYLCSYTMDLTMNAILFSDDAISQKYNNGGEMNKATSLSLSIISSLIGKLFTWLIQKMLIYSTVFDILIKEEKVYKKYIKKIKECLRYIICKFVTYYIFLISIHLFALYNNTLFCGVYQGSQKNWVMDFILGIGLSLIEVGISCLVISVFRFLSLKCKWEYLYNLSVYINSIL